MIISFPFRITFSRSFTKDSKGLLSDFIYNLHQSSSGNIKIINENHIVVSNIVLHFYPRLFNISSGVTRTDIIVENNIVK